TPSARARSTVVRRIFTCARWMPSKAPSAVTDGASSAGNDGSPWRIRMQESLGLDELAPSLAHPEEGAVGAVHAQEPGAPRAAGHRLAMDEGLRGAGVEHERR